MEAFDLIAEVGLPIASGLIMAFFIFLVMKQMMVPEVVVVVVLVNVVAVEEDF